MELLAALVVIVLGLLGILYANTYAQRTSEGSYEQMVAIQDAHRAIELIRNTASSGGIFPQSVTGAFPNNGLVGGFNNLFNEQVRVNYANPIADPLDVTITTTWLEGGLRNRTAQLRTLITQRE